SLTQNSDESHQGETTLLSLARNLLLHPATRELRLFQQRITTQAWAKILENITFKPHSPAKKKKKTEVGTKTGPSKIVRLLTEDTLDTEDIGEISLAKLDDIEDFSASRIEELIKILSCLDLECLPDVNLRCQIGAVTLLSWLQNRPDCDTVRDCLERLLVRSVSVANTSRLFRIIPSTEFLRFITGYCEQKHGSSRSLLEASVQAVMNEHSAVLHMPGFVKQVLKDLASDTTSLGIVKFQLLSLIVKHCQKYLKKAFHVKEVGQAATEVYFCVARFVIKNGLGWYKNLELSFGTGTQRKANDEVPSATKVLDRDTAKRKRKRQQSEETDDGHKISSNGASVKRAAGERSDVGRGWDSLLSCVSEVLDLWDEQVAEEKVNQHLELVVVQILDIILFNWVRQLEKAELRFIQSCCYCQLRSSKTSRQDAELEKAGAEDERAGGLGFLTSEVYPKLWTACFRQAQETLSGQLSESEALNKAVLSLRETNQNPDQQGREALHVSVEGVGLETDVLCALLESSAPEMFVALLEALQDRLVSSKDLDPLSVVVAVDVWRKLFQSGVLPEESSRLLFKNMYQILSSLLSIVQNFTHCRSGQDDVSHAQISDLLSVTPKRVACRCIVRALADFAELGKTLVTPRMTLLCLHAGFNLDLEHPADVEVMCNLLNTLLIRHTNTMLSAVPAVLDLVN
ncbi:hypothetical protein EGW08_017228, partial [Elysia chlorotica]